MTELLLKNEVYAIVGAAMEVHNVLGCGFLEPEYQEALELELSERGIPFVAQQGFPIFYKGHSLQKIYIADLIAFDKIVVELKALDFLSNLEEAQIINYLKVTKLEVGLLINFGAPKLDWKRMVLSQPIKSTKFA